VIRGYAGLLSWLRPVYNGWAALRGRPRLPRPGQALHYLTAALSVVAHDDAAVFDALVQALLVRAEMERWGHVVFGMADDDPLLESMRRYSGTWYTTRIFHVAWPGSDAFLQSLDRRPTYLELGRL